MKKLFAIAAFLLASTAAQAQYTFEYGGRTIRIDPDRGTVSIPGVYDNTGRRNKRSRNDQDSDRPRKQAPSRPRSIRKLPPRPPHRPNRLQPRPQTPRRPLQLRPRMLRRRIPQLRRLRPARRHHTVRRTPPPPPSPRHRRRWLRRRPQRHRSAGPCSRGIRRSCRELAARRLADRRERGQGPDRTMRRQSLRIFRGRQVEPERRTGSDQHEARQGFQMERPHSRPEHRQHL